MVNIKKLRQAYSAIYPDMPIAEFIDIAGLPDSCIGTLEEGLLTWSDSVWKGILRGGTVFRKVILLTKNGRIVQFSSENLNVSAWL